jgi:succinoglycan biosynthesis protein ExoA
MSAFDVIIATKNRAEELKTCLGSLAAQVDPVHVIVVDAHSEDGTREVTEGFGAEFFYEPPSNVVGSRAAVARNEGLRHSSSKYVAFLDSDVEVPPTWSRDMVNAMVKWESGCCSLEWEDVPHPVAGVTSGCVPSDTPQGWIMKAGSPNHAKRFTEATPVTSLPSYNCVYLRSALDKVGGFNEVLGGCEDWELNHRLIGAGYALLGVPESPVNHHERDGLQAFAHQMYGYGWSRGRLLRVKKIFKWVHALPSLLLFIGTFILTWGIGYLVGLLYG